MIKRIGILTSGGDAPGMNAAIRAVVKRAIKEGIEVYGIYDGYKGLLQNNIHELTSKDVDDIITMGGTILGCARLDEFHDIDVQRKAKEILFEHGIEALVVMGGDGTYRGALALSNLGINCVGIPTTIDNDITSTDYSIGFSTACSTAVEAIERLIDTSSSHTRCSIVEVMGRLCGDIASQTALAVGANMVITPNEDYDFDKVCDMVHKAKIMGKRHVVIVVCENVLDVEAFASELEKKTGFECRATVLGHIQRGGRPTVEDRTLATRLGNHAVEVLLDEKKAICLGIINNKIVETPIVEALKMQKEGLQSYVEIVEKLA